MKKTIIFFSLCACALSARALPAPTAASYAWGAQLTVAGYDASKEALSDFPVLVRVSPETVSGFQYSQMLSSSTGADLCFIDSLGNGLPFEIDTWDPQGTSLVWVTLPTMQQGSQFVMCWGSATSGKTVCSANPFAGYKGVWHMNSTSPADASGSGNDGTGAGSVALASGVVGYGLSYPNTSSYVSCGSSQAESELTANGYTIEGWVNLATTSGTKALFGKSGFISYRMEGTAVKITTPGVTDYNNVDNFITTANEWHHFALSFKPNTTGGAKHYVDGVLKASQNTTGINNSTGSIEMWLGRNQWKNDQNFVGLLDEYRLSPTIRSADWIYASRASQLDPSFVTAGQATPYEASAEPQVGLAVTDVQYTNATFNVAVGSLGMDGTMTSDASWVDMLLLVGTSADLSSPLFTVPLDRVSTAPSSVSKDLTGLNYDTAYYAQVLATNSFGVAGESGVAAFRTSVPGPVFSASVDAEHLAPDISLSFTDAGWGGSVDRITVQVSDSDDFAHPAATKTFDVELSAMPTNFDGIALSGLPRSSPLHFRFVARNSRGFETTVDRTVAVSLSDGDNVWSGLSADVDDADAYVFAGGLPASGKTLYFTKPAGLSPVIDRDTTMPMLRFTNGKNESVETGYRKGYHSCGYDFSGSGVLTFAADKPIVQASYGTNVIQNPIRFSRSNTQTVTLLSVGDNAWLRLDGSLLLPAGVSNTTMSVTGRGNTVLGGPSPDFMGQLSVPGGRLTFASPFAMTNVSAFSISGDPSSMSNATGAPLVFPRVTSICIDHSWGGRKWHLYGAPFVFPQATFEWAIRDYNSSTFDADCVVSNLVVRKNDSNGDASVNKIGTGAFIVKGETTWYDPSVKSSIKITSGCFWPQTAAGLPPTGEIYLPGGNSSYGTLGLGGDYSPMLDGSATPRVFQSSTEARWGFTGFGGDRTVCWNADPSLNLTNTTSGKVAVKLTDTTSVNVDGKTFDTYYAYPACFMFGNRSEFADGTVVFRNPIRYELGQNWDTSTYFESTNHVVAARMRGSLRLGNRDKTWNFSGRNFGGYLALEAENTDFTGKVNVYEKGNLLVNSNLVARSVTVQSRSGLGGIGSLSTGDGTTVKSGGALFGGEWNKGGTLALVGKVTLESGSALRAEVGASNDRIGMVKLAAGSTLKLSAPVYVDVDTDPRVSPVRGAAVKILDWSEATFDSGSAPTLADFVGRPESNSDLETVYVFTRADGLYINYISVRYPPATIMLLR